MDKYIIFFLGLFLPLPLFTLNAIPPEQELAELIELEPDSISVQNEETDYRYIWVAISAAFLVDSFEITLLKDQIKTSFRPASTACKWISWGFHFMQKLLYSAGI